MSIHPPIVGLTLNYRDARRTLRCVDSLFQEGAAHVMIWDNSEDSGVSAGELRHGLKGNSRTTVEVSPVNLGFAAGVNRGMEHIRERFGQAWVLILNNDAYLLPGALATLSDALVQQPDAAIAFPDIDHAGRVLGPVYYQRHTGLLTSHRLPGSFLYASGCCQLIAAERLQGPAFDEDFFMYGEDWAQGWMLGEQGMAHVAQTLVYHEGSRSSGIGSDFYESRIVAAHWILAKKVVRSPLELPLLYGLRLLSLSARGLLRSLRHRSWRPLRALPTGWQLARMPARATKPRRGDSR